MPTQVDEYTVATSFDFGLLSWNRCRDFESDRNVLRGLVTQEFVIICLFAVVLTYSVILIP